MQKYVTHPATHSRNLARSTTNNTSAAAAYSSTITFHETQRWPFVESIHAGIGNVMCTYNYVNQTFACENRQLLDAVLKGELDFQVSTRASAFFVFVFWP